jgi:hypothetical protein
MSSVGTVLVGKQIEERLNMLIALRCVLLEEECVRLEIFNLDGLAGKNDSIIICQKPLE